MRQSHEMRIGKVEFPYSYAIEAFGVRLAVHANREDALLPIIAAARSALPVTVKKIDAALAEHHFSYQWSPRGHDSLFPDREQPVKKMDREMLLGLLETKLRLTVAEFAKEHVFVHAGVVGWNGKGIVLPGRSMDGKTTLTLELIKRGAEYYSDEYAVIDKRGRLTPFPKTISLRGITDQYRQVEFSPSHFGATIGAGNIPVGLVALTKYAKGSRWQPVRLSAAQGVLGLIDNTVGARTSPALMLTTLTKVADKAIILQTKRGNAARAADELLKVADK